MNPRKKVNDARIRSPELCVPVKIDASDQLDSLFDENSPSNTSKGLSGDEPLESGADTQCVAYPMRGRQERHVTRKALINFEIAQEKVPGSLTVGTIAGEDMISPPPQHGAGLLHGSHDGVPHGAQAGAPQAGVVGMGGC